jgi:nitrogen fixation/metabolism regulation signal transduction histidine kinase
MSHPTRKKTFIDAKVQGALVRRLFMHWASFITVAAVVAFALQILTNPFRPLEQHLQEMWWTHGPFLLVMFFMLPVFIVDTIKLSHRFAGPIYRLRNVIKGMAEGEPFRPVKFREMDFWQDLADDFNTMIERVGKANEARGSEPIETEAGVLVDK